MKIIDCQQYSPEWHEARKGIPTASRFDSIITPKTGKPSSAAAGYVCELIGQLYDPHYGIDDGPMSRDMARGLEAEPEARGWYEMERSCEVSQVGFCLSDCGRWGCSPDGLVGEDGGLEIKNPSPKVHVGYLLAGVLPDEYKAQVHGHLVVSKRNWWDFLSYCPGLPELLVRVEPDDFTLALRDCLEVFAERLASSLAKIRALTHSPVSEEIPF